MHISGLSVYLITFSGRAGTKFNSFPGPAWTDPGVAQAELRELVASLGAVIVACTLRGAQG